MQCSIKCKPHHSHNPHHHFTSIVTQTLAHYLIEVPFLVQFNKVFFVSCHHRHHFTSIMITTQTLAHSPMEVTFLVTEIRFSPVSLHSCPSTMQSEIQGGRQWLDLANKTRSRGNIQWKMIFLRMGAILGWRMC